jgi:hypothetical protein
VPLSNDKLVVVLVASVELANVVGEVADGDGERKVGAGEGLLGQRVKTYLFACCCLKIDRAMAIHHCFHCGRVVTSANLGALIPDDEQGERIYCQKCTLKAIDDHYKTRELEAFV